MKLMTKFEEMRKNRSFIIFFLMSYREEGGLYASPRPLKLIFLGPAISHHFFFLCPVLFVTHTFTLTSGLPGGNGGRKI